MRGAGNDRELALGPDRSLRLVIQFEGQLVAAADDQQCGSMHVAQPFSRGVGASAARDDRADRQVRTCGGPQRRPRAGAGPEEADG